MLLAGTNQVKAEVAAPDTSVAVGAAPDTTVAIASSDMRFSRLPRSHFVYRYLNDNKPLGTLPVANGPDDLVTTSFWAQWRQGRRAGALIWDVSLTLLTNKEADYRSDLLRISMSWARETRNLEWSAGLGILARGRMGGAFIQNSFHGAIGVAAVELPYTKSSVSPLAVSTLASRPFRISTFRSGVYSEVSQVIGPGPSRFLGGGYIRCCGPTNSNFPALRIDLAYISYYGMGQVTKPMYGSGFSPSAMITSPLGSFISAGVRVSRNEFGVDQIPQYGLVINIGAPASLGNLYR
ncbi:MAG: hypothetical protein HKN29_14940 [Rhodothermales bacterium]|nr:hypothetical protein [Rhodothermales bacterium]